MPHWLYKSEPEVWSWDRQVEAGPAGMSPGVIAERLALPGSSLSFHLKELARSGLVDIEQRGRNLIYRAHFGQMNGLLAYLTEHCCQGANCEVQDAAVACTTC